jgi:uncharacterized protein (TIGR03000 family)
VLGLAPAAEAQLLPFAWRTRPKVLFRYGRGNWAYTNYQRYYDPGAKQYFWGWPGDFYGIEYSQPALSNSIPPVLLLDLAGGVGWERRGHILVRVPAKDAAVWFNDYQTPQQGYERSFDSPAFQAGSPLTYQVRARWAEGPERSRTVTLEPGQEVVVDFTTEP